MNLLHTWIVWSMVFATAGVVVGQEPSSGDAHLSAAYAKVEDALRTGRFREAEAQFAAEIGDTGGPATSEAGVALEVLRRIRRDYPLPPVQMLEKLRSRVRDVSAEDVERWQKDGSLQHRVIDGQVRFFRREPSNLFRFCKEAAARRIGGQPDASGEFDLVKHIERLVKAGEQSDEPVVFPVRHEVTYKLTVREDHPLIKKGARIRCWLPYPQAYRQQSDVRNRTCKVIDGDTTIAPNGSPHRTICYERTIADPDEPIEFEVAYSFVTSAYVPRLDPARVRDCDKRTKLYRQNTAERLPHIVFTPQVRSIVRDVCADEANPLERARKLFRWVCENMDYCAEIEYSTIPNISDKALTTRRGDCGVQALAFITLCRAAGIPARWQSGWETLPGRWNMHDWAEFYVEPWGWLPADPSYGMQEHADPRVREFYCGGLDPYRMIVNLDHGRELLPPKMSFRSEPADFQRGELEIDGHNLYFDDWRWEFEARTMPLAGDWAAVEESLDAVVPDRLSEGSICGAVIEVGRRHGGKFETWRKAYGYMQSEPSHVAMREDAVFDMASLTKPVATGTSLMVLADRGLVDLDSPVSTYLPEYAHGDKGQVTVRHLMTHRSGLKPYLSMKERSPVRELKESERAAALRRIIRTLDLSGKPGDRIIYSCLNAITCAEIVEAVAKQPLDAFARDNVFKPLGMTDTIFCPLSQLDERIVPTTRHKRGRGEGGFLRGQVHDPLGFLQGGVSGNAGLFSTAKDLGHFAQMMLTGGTLGEAHVLKADTVREMTRDQTEGAVGKNSEPNARGLLWDIYPAGTGDKHAGLGSAFGHTGYTGTALRVYPGAGVYIIVLANRVHPDDSGKVAALRRDVWQTVADALGGKKQPLDQASRGPTE